MAERFEMRVENSLLREIDSWRSDQADYPSRSEAFRRLAQRGLDGSNMENFMAVKLQILLAAVTPGLESRVSDSYAFAWEHNVFPLFHESVKWHKSSKDEFEITEDMMSGFLEHLDEIWLRNEKIPNFYELESKFAQKDSVTAWTRERLINALTYTRLCGRFDSNFFEDILEPMQHPVEAGAIIRKYSKSDIFIG